MFHLRHFLLWYMSSMMTSCHQYHYILLRWVDKGIWSVSVPYRTVPRRSVRGRGICVCEGHGRILWGQNCCKLLIWKWAFSFFRGRGGCLHPFVSLKIRCKKWLCFFLPFNIKRIPQKLDRYKDTKWCSLLHFKARNTLEQMRIKYLEIKITSSKV